MSLRPRTPSTAVAAPAPRARLDEVLSVGRSLGALGLGKKPDNTPIVPTEGKRKRNPPVMPKFTQYKKSVDPSDIFSQEGRFYEQDISGVPVAVAKKFGFYFNMERVGLGPPRPRDRPAPWTPVYEDVGFTTHLSGNAWPQQPPQYLYLLGHLERGDSRDWRNEKRLDSEAFGVQFVPLNTLSDLQIGKLKREQAEVLNRSFERLGEAASHNRDIAKREAAFGEFVRENGTTPALNSEHYQLHPAYWNSSAKYDWKKDKWSWGERSEYEQSLLMLPSTPEDFEPEVEPLVYAPLESFFNLKHPDMALRYVLWIATEKLTGIRRMVALTRHGSDLSLDKNRYNDIYHNHDTVVIFKSPASDSSLLELEPLQPVPVDPPRPPIPMPEPLPMPEPPLPRVPTPQPLPRAPSPQRAMPGQGAKTVEEIYAVYLTRDPYEEDIADINYYMEDEAVTETEKIRMILQSLVDMEADVWEEEIDPEVMARFRISKGAVTVLPRVPPMPQMPPEARAKTVDEIYKLYLAYTDPDPEMREVMDEELERASNTDEQINMLLRTLSDDAEEWQEEIDPVVLAKFHATRKMY